MNSTRPSKVSKYRCCICNSVRGASGDNRRFHKFPKEPEMKKQWIMAIGKPYLLGKKSINLRVCSKHFIAADYRSCRMVHLNASACPSKVESSKLPKMDIDKLREKIQKSMQEYVENSYCFVPGCESVCNHKDSRTVSMFFPPIDENLFAKWKLALPRTDKELTRDKLICELHFHEQDIERFRVTKLSNGYLDITEKEKPTLKYGAVPSIFINMPVLSKRTVEKLSSLQNHVINISDAESITTSISDSQVMDDNFVLTSAVEEPFSYQILLVNISLIQKPNDWWAISPCVKCIICARWNSEYIPVKRIIIEDDLTVKVFLLEVELNITEHRKLTCIDDISALLQKVESYKICTIADLIN